MAGQAVHLFQGKEGKEQFHRGGGIEVFKTIDPVVVMVKAGLVVSVPVDAGIQDLVTEGIGPVKDPFELGGSMFPEKFFQELIVPGISLAPPVLGQGRPREDH